MSSNAPPALYDLVGQEPQDLLSGFAAHVRRRSEEAQGVGENALFHGLNVAKTIADGTAHMGSLAWRTARAVGRAISDFDGPYGIGEDVAAGWEAGSQDIERFAGTRDAGAIDYLQAASEKVAGAPAKRWSGLTLGQAADQKIQEKLGRAAIASSAAGTVLSFATGPGALVGKAGAEMVAPLGMMAEKTIAKSVAKGKLTAEQAKRLVENGKFWQWASKEIPAGKNIGKHLLRLSGRNVNDLLGLTAGNIAQSYALSPESEAMDGAYSALAASPLLLPIAKFGGVINRWMTGKFLGDAEKAAAVRIYREMAEGAITPAEASVRFSKEIPRLWRAANAALVSAVEGTAFSALDPHGREQWKKAVGGDLDALNEILMVSAGSMAGLMTLKYRMPPDIAPMFRHARPDLNTLETRLEAEAVKAAAKQAEDAADLDLLAQAHEQKLKEHYAPFVSDAAAPIRAGWEPRFDAPEGSLMFTFGDSMIDVSRTDGGDIKVTLDDKAHAALKEISPDVAFELTGEDARKALNDLSLLALRANANAVSNYVRLGFEETADGQWMAGSEGLVYTPNLDGSSSYKNILSDLPAGSEHVVTLGGYGPDQMEGHPTLGAFAEAVAQKQALVPDPVVDPLLVAAVNEARHGTGTGADTLREFFSSVPPDLLMAKLKPGDDAKLAAMFGEAIRGHGNARTLLAEFAQPEPTKAAELDAAQRAAYENRGQADPGTTPEQRAQYGGLGLVVSPESQRRAVRAGTRAYDLALESQVEAIRPYGKTDFPDQIRRALSEGKTTLGKAQEILKKFEGVAKKSKNARKLMELVDVGEPEPVLRWIGLIEGKIEPVNDAERKFAAGGDETLRKLWGEGVAAQVTNVRQNAEGNLERQLITPRDRAVVPRTYDEQYYELLQDDAVRPKFFERLAANNDIKVRVADPETGKVTVKRATGEDLEQQHKDRLAQAEKLSDPEREAALEFVRQLKHVPAEFEGYRILERNPFQAMRRIIREQSARLGVVKVLGQDMPAADRQRLGITKPGAKAELERWLRDVSDPTMREVSSDVLELAQGRIQTANMRLSPLVRAATLGPLEGLFRSALTVASWVHDVAPLHVGASAGWRTTLKAFGQVAKNPREAIEYGERVGTIMRDMGQWDIQEADSAVYKLQDAFGLLGKWSERAKTALMTKVADNMLERWTKGKATINDRQVLRDMLRDTPAEVDALLSGKADDATRNKFRHEMVEFLTDRSPSATASRLAASPNAQRLLRFTRWATGRMRNVARAFVSVQRAVRSGDAKEIRAASKRLLSTGFWMTVGGTVGQALSYIWADMFRNATLDPTVGLKRWWEAASYAPASMAGKALRNQLIGGPFAQMAQAAQDTDSAWAWAHTTAPGSILYSLSKASERVASVNTGRELMENMGGIATSALADLNVVPREMRDLTTAVQMFALGEDPTNLQSRRLVNDWKRLEGIESQFGQKNKPGEFYAAMARVRRAVNRHPDDRKAALNEAAADIKTALALAPEESVASSIRGYQLAHSLSPEQREKLAEFIGDDDRMRAIYAHDLALRDIAREVGKMEGTYQSPFHDELQRVQSQARLGAADDWKPLADRVVDEGAAAMESGSPINDDLDELAEAMALFPEQLGSVFGEKQMRVLQNPRMDLASRANLISYTLKKRTRAHQTREEKERRDAERGR